MNPRPMPAMRLGFLLVEQVSPDVEQCLRCDMIAKASELPAGITHFAMLDDIGQLDHRQAAVLCRDCAQFIYDAAVQEAAAKRNAAPGTDAR
jgi:hypothetical protein